MNKKLWITLGVFPLFFWNSLYAGPKYSEIESDDDRKEIMDRINQNNVYRNSVENIEKRELCSIIEIVSPGEPVVNEVREYIYDSGMTLITLYDAQSGQVLSVQRKQAYATPASEREIERAKKIAESQNAEIKSIILDDEGKLEVKILNPVYSSPDHELFGKRVIKVTYYRYVMVEGKRKLKRSHQVSVNLTDEKIVQ